MTGELAAGSEVGRFCIESRLGSGGMGVVYRATDPELERPVALKLIRPELSADPDFRRRFERERKAQARLDHPNIVHVYDSGVVGENLYLVSQHIDGPSLAELLARGPLGSTEALPILRQIAAALDFAHDAGTVHRDVKPSNILVGADGRAFLTDFGLAWLPGQDRVTSAGGFVGTAAYASPEQLRGAVVSRASDVYSLACVLRECLTGSPALPAAHAQDLPAALEEAIARGTAERPGSRYARAGSLIEAAEEALGEVGEIVPGRAPERARVPARQVPPTRSGLAVPARAQPSTVADRAPSADVPREPPRPPRGGAGRGRRRGRPPALVWLGVGLVGLLAVGYLAGRGAGGGGSLQSASSNEIAIEYPSGWSPGRSGPRIPGLSFERPVRLAGPSAKSADLTAGIVDAGGKLLLPRDFLRTLERLPRQSETIATGAGRAYRYPRLRPRGFDRELDVYVLPTTAGVATVTCDGLQAAADRAQCGAIAASLELLGARPYPLGPSASYARVLNRVLTRLRRRRAAGRGRIERAGNTAGQAAAARSLAHAFDDAGRRLARPELSPQVAGANAAVATAMRATASAYRRLAAAAAGMDADAYGVARAQAQAGEARLRRRLRGLRRVGYRAG